MTELREFHQNEPASVASLRQFERLSGFALPDEYVSFLQRSNGGEGYSHQGRFLSLWRLEELLPLNDSYQAPQLVPSLFIFGSNGGGEAFAFDRRTAELPIVCVPFVGMHLSLIKILAQGFQELIDLRWLHPRRDETPSNAPRGMEIFEIKPVMLGGSPTDPTNKIVLTRDDHVKAVRYWNNVINEVRKAKEGSTR